MTRTGKLLAELIALPSVNPAFAPSPTGSSMAGLPRAGKFGEKNMADYLMAVAARAGLDVALQPVIPADRRTGFPDRSNVLVRLAPPGPIRRTVLLAPHLDTVDAADAGFIPRRVLVRMHGRGACDTKGCVAAMLMALCDLAHSKTRPHETEIFFAGLIDEEQGQAGSRALVASEFKADLAIVGEPTRLQAVTAHKGSLWLELETRGRAAHGATPQLGKNAVHEMARIVDVLETEYAARLKKKRHPLLGAATVNVGTICGGSQPNIVPAGCAIGIDRRTLPGETEASVRREIAALLKSKKLNARFYNRKLAPALPMETSPRLPLVRDFMSSIGQTKPCGVNYFCDAAVLSAGGIPSLVFGPGDIAQAHTADEWISLASLERGQQMLLRFLQSLP